MTFHFARATLVLSSVALIGSASAASAAAITSLYNTGVDAAGVSRPDGSLGDLHYTVTAPSGSQQTRVMTSAGGYPIGPWNGDNTISAWISPNNSSDGTGPTGNYVYTTTFDLTGFDFTTASITGGWATDDVGTNIRLNGVNTGQTGGFGNFSAFSLTSGFIAGLNTLQFLVFNDGNNGPTGLRVQMTGTATALDVPEPATLALLGIGLIGLVARLRTGKAEQKAS